MLVIRCTYILILVSILSHSSTAQVTGGQSVLVGLTLESSPRVTALGGYVVSCPSGDVDFSVQNPALLDSTMDGHASINFLDYYAQTNTYSIAYAKYRPDLKTTFSTAFIYDHYGDFTRTDETGTVLGEYSALDYLWQLSASRYYRDRWSYGASLKFGGAQYAGYSSFALLLDAGVYYTDTARGLSLGAVAKNIGLQLKKFNTSIPSEPLPFDFQIGLTKKFAHLPFRLSVVAHHFFQWNIRYDNPADVSRDVLFGDDAAESEQSYFFDKFFRHFTFGGEILLGKKLHMTLAYNHLRRSELTIKNARGLGGFSMGLDLYYKKWSLHYGKAVYNQVGGTNHLGLNLYLGEFF